MSDDEYGLDEDLDEDLLAAVEQAEKQHTLLSSQLPRPKTETTSRPSAPPPAKKPFVQQQQQPPKPLHQVQQRQQSRPPPSRPVYAPPQAGRGRGPAKPVYKDDFPNIDLDERGGYRPRGSSAAPTATGPPPRTSAAVATPAPAIDAEKERMKAELQQLRAAIETEKQARVQKEGEVSVLRSNADRASKQHSKELDESKSRTSGLQERIDALERTAMEDKQRHKSDLLFSRQEHESAIRHRGSQYPSTVAKNRFLQSQNSRALPTFTAKQSPKRAPYQKKGFENSFLEDGNKQNISRGGRGSPTSSPSRRAPNGSPVPLVNGNGKGKERALIQEASFEGNDFIDEQEGQADDGEVLPELPETRSSRESFISFLFAHQPVPPSDPVSTIHSIINANLPPNTDESLKEEYVQACEKLFACLGRVSTSSSATYSNDVEIQDRLFLSNLVSSLLPFNEIFGKTSPPMREGIITSLYLLRDLLFHFHSLLFQQEEVLEEVQKTIRSAFVVLVRMVQTETARTRKSLEVSTARTTQVRSSATQAGTTRPNSEYRGKAERQLAPVLVAVVQVLTVMAWQPNETCLASFDASIRENDFLSALLDTSRQASVVSATLELLILLASQPTLFRTILAAPLTVRESSSRPTSAGSGNSIPAIDTLAILLYYSKGTHAQNYVIRLAVLSIFSTLAVEHADGVPLLGQSSLMLQRIIVRISQDAATLYDGDLSTGLAGHEASDLVHILNTSLRLLHFLVLSYNSPKSLSSHLAERPVGQDYFVTGIGRVACTEPPDWITDQAVVRTLAEASNVALDMLQDVLSPDEVEELYILCRDEEDEDEDYNGLQDQTLDDDEAQLAAQNIDAMEE